MSCGGAIVQKDRLVAGEGARDTRLLADARCKFFEGDHESLSVHVHGNQAPSEHAHLAGLIGAALDIASAERGGTVVTCLLNKDRTDVSA